MLGNAEHEGLRVGLKWQPGPVVHASGELDYRNCQGLNDLLEAALSAHGPVVELALGDLDFVDSSGLRVLIVSAIKAREEGGSLCIKSMTSHLSRMLDVSGFRHLFEISAVPVEPSTGRPDDTARGEWHELRLPPEVDACRDARNKVCEYAMRLGFTPADLDDIRLAVGEAVSNAVRHGDCNGKPIELGYLLQDGKLRIALRYPSAVFSPCDIPTPTAESGCNGGMGIYFMTLVMDSATYSFEDGYATLTLEKNHAPGKDLEPPG